MKPPYIGIITQAWGQSTYQSEAVKLGVQIRSENVSMSAETLIEFAKVLDFVYVDPKIISLPAIKSAEKSGVKVYPTSKTLEKLDQISMHSTQGEHLSILVARSAHAQAVTWPISLLTGDISITPLPGITDEISQEIQVSALKLADEVGLVGGFEIYIDAVDYKKLDKYQRKVGKVILDKQDICLVMIELGLAWHYKDYEKEQSKTDRDLYSQAELKARESRIGLWQLSNAIEPSAFRHK